MKLSIAIATFNEQDNILRCLRSIYDLADEIILVDGSSTDKTVELVKNNDKDKKIQIFVEDNKPMFHQNKQKAIKRGQGEWILQLDADEIVSDDLKKEILNIVAADQRVGPVETQNFASLQNAGEHMGSPLQKYNAYWLPRLNYFLGQPLRKGGQYPDYTIRLYKNGAAHFPCKTIHEQVEIKGKVGYLKSPLLHHPYKTFNDYLIKWKRYNKLEAEQLKVKGFRPNILNGINYLLIQPTKWFFISYFRHLGILDGPAGFVFSLFSALRFWGIYAECSKK